MSRKPSSQDEIRERLKDAIDGLRKDATRVEIWAAALTVFSEPVPPYKPDDKFRLGKATPEDQAASTEAKNRRHREPRKGR